MTDRKALAAWTLLQGHRFIWNLVLTVALMMVVVALFMRSTAENAEANLIESRARAKARMLPPIPDEENAAVLYRQAFKLKKRPRDSNCPAYNAALDADSALAGLKPELLLSKDVQSYIASFGPELQLARQAAQLRQCNWGTDYSLGMKAILDKSSGARDLARRFVLEAANFAKAGNHAAAAENLRAITRFSEHLRTDSSLLDALVSNSMREMAIGGLQKILFLYPPTRSEEVKAYREALETNDDPWLIALNMVAGERILMLITLDEEAVNRRVFRTNQGFFPAAIELPYVPWYGSDRKTIIAMYDDVEMNLRAQRREFIFESDDARIARLRKGPFMYAKMLGSSTPRVVKALISSAQLERSTVLALAALEFRLKHGHDIVEIEELVPEILSALPIDQIESSRSLVMRRDDHGYFSGNQIRTDHPQAFIKEPGLIRFYSLGWNGKDDHGYSEDGNAPLPHEPEIRKLYPGADDITFAIPPLKKNEPKKEAAP